MARPGSFRQAMGPLHTWSGLLLGGLLFAVFWSGTLIVFDREIDRWMQPSTRLPAAAAAPAAGLDGPVLATVRQLTAGAPSWFARLPTARQPTVEVTWKPAGQADSASRHLDPRTGEVLPDTGSQAGTGFLFKLHYSFHLDWQRLGPWIVGAAGMGLLLLLVSGVVIHRRLLADFFLFRPQARLQRASLDLHNLTGVLLLPFHLMITATGLAIFINTHWPTVYAGAYGAAAQPRQAFFAEAYASYKRPAAGRPAATSAPLDAMLAQARREWSDEVAFVRTWHPGDANGYVEVRRAHAGITMRQDTLWFDAASGRLLERFSPQPVMQAQRFIVGLHFTQFHHWTLRWLYFAGGLAGCVMIATGLLFWLESRRARHARDGRCGVVAAEAASVGAVAGVVVATLAWLVANRLLPPDPAWGPWGRASLEAAVFWTAWAAAFAHAGWRAWRQDPGRASAAWREQAWAVAVLAPLAVALNWATTGHHLAHTVAHGLPAVAGMDLLLLALGAGAALTARRLGRRPAFTRPAAARHA